MSFDPFRQLEELARAFDFPAAPAGDQSLLVDTEHERRHEHLPQLGPPFVAYVHERFTKLDAAMERALAKWSEKPSTWVGVSSFNTDASGNVGRNVQDKAIILDPNPGWTFALHRLAILATGFNFGTPFNAAGAYWELRSNDEAIDGGSLVSGAGSFPVVRTWGTRDAPHLRDGEQGSIFIVGTAALANKGITVKTQGTWIREADA